MVRAPSITMDESLWVAGPRQKWLTWVKWGMCYTKKTSPNDLVNGGQKLTWHIFVVWGWPVYHIFFLMCLRGIKGWSWCMEPVPLVLGIPWSHGLSWLHSFLCWGHMWRPELWVTDCFDLFCVLVCWWQKGICPVSEGSFHRGSSNMEQSGLSGEDSLVRHCC